MNNMRVAWLARYEDMDSLIR